jgi:hypothetical protein
MLAADPSQSVVVLLRLVLLPHLVLLVLVLVILP